MEPISVAYLGIALITTLAFIGSSYGVTVCGNAVVGAMKKNPGALGSYIALCALPSSNGLYGFVAYFILQPFIVPDMPMITALGILASGIILGVGGCYASVRQADVCANGIVGIGSGYNLFAATMVMAVFPELYSILALLVSILISFSFAAPIVM